LRHGIPQVVEGLLNICVWGLGKLVLDISQKGWIDLERRRRGLNCRCWRWIDSRSLFPRLGQLNRFLGLLFWLMRWHKTGAARIRQLLSRRRSIIGGL
jgi:hypothetical protein